MINPIHNLGRIPHLEFFLNVLEYLILWDLLLPRGAAFFFFLKAFNIG